MDELLTRWDDAFELANNTPRMSLPPIIGNLQTLQREGDKITPPECAEDIANSFQEYSNYIVKGFLLFLDSKKETTATMVFSLADDRLSAFVDAYGKLKSSNWPITQSAPVAKPTQAPEEIIIICQKCEEAGIDINIWTTPQRLKAAGKVPHFTRGMLLNTEEYDKRVLYLVSAKGIEGWVTKEFIHRNN